ncbi:hypothetical protein [Rhodobacteraceae bacterium DSL-40]|uniref:hypothetical protein n=1 Tax=Amaricoccus sp. B4 TaxID=3368557 RepID=UPI0013A6E6A5
MAWIVLALSTQVPEGVAGRRVADEPADLLKDPERILAEQLEMENVRVFQAEPGGKA